MRKLSLFASAAIIASIGITGCGGGSSSSEASAGTPVASTVTVAGTAIDPELVNATVCLDINGDENCTTADPSTHTDQNGQYTLTLTQEQIEANYPLLAMGGVDKATGEAFKGKLLADLNSSVQNITPLTTLLHAQLQGVHDEAEAELQLTTLLGLTTEELQANIVALANQGDADALKTALMLQKSAEAIIPENTLAFYQELAQKIHTSVHTQVEALIVEMAPDDIKTDMVAFIEALMNTHVTNAHAIAEEAHDMALARGLDWENRIIETYHNPFDGQAGDNTDDQTDDQNESVPSDQEDIENNVTSPEENPFGL